MKKIISKETKSALMKLGIYQIIGGAIGMLIILGSILGTPLLTGLTVLLYLFILLFFLYSIFCGVLCLKAKKKALHHSLANQILQVFGFAMIGFAFKYIAGLYLTIGLNLTDSFQFSFGAGVSSFNFNFNNEKERIELDFNIIALLLIFWIDTLMKKVKDETAIRQENSISNL